MNVNDPQFWMMVASIVTSIMFVVMAITLIAITVIFRRVVRTIHRVEEKFDPLIFKVNAIGKQGQEISVQFNEISQNISTTTRYLSESAGLIREEVAELKQLVGVTAETAKQKVELVSQTIDRTQLQVVSTTDYVQAKVVEPARELAAVMAGVRKGLEVLFAPSPKQIDRAYHDDEMFIG